MITALKFLQLSLFTLLSIALIGCSSSSGGGGGSIGSGGTPALEVSPLTDFDFGIITVGNSAAPLVVTITNTGVGRLDIADIRLSDSNNFELDPTFVSSNSCATVSPALPTSDSCTVEIKFTPQQTGSFSETLEVVPNDSAIASTTLTLKGISEPVGESLPVGGAPPVVQPLGVIINQIDIDDTSCSIDNTQVVTAFVSVTDQGNFPITGLTLDDFDIQEDIGSTINPTTAPNVAMVTEPVSIALVMDNSSSLSEVDITEMETQAIEIVNMLGPSDAVEIIKFNREVKTLQEFTTNKEDLITAIQIPFIGDGTALFDAIQKAVMDVSSQPTDRNVVIVITDGDDRSSVIASSQDIIDASPSNGIPIYAIAIGDDLSTGTIDALQSITDASSAELYEAEVSQNLATIIQQQLSEVLFVDQYVLTYTSTSTGAGTVDLKVTATQTGPPLLTGFDNRDIAQCP